MYRILAGHHGGVRERRDRLTLPGYAKPELLAEWPNELWSWDVSKLTGPAKWTYFYLYVILDVFSRYAVGWTVQYRENGQLAKTLIEQATEQQQITLEILTLHADRGSPQHARVPDRFETIEHARGHCRVFFDWYNHHHRHSGIGSMTPAAFHHGRATDLHAARGRVLNAAYERYPERFVRKPPVPPELPTTAWINKPATKEVAH